MSPNRRILTKGFSPQAKTWVVFGACVIVGFVVLGWFSREMLRLEAGTEEARRTAELEERVRLALWRMDSALAGLQGLEAARPWQDYEAFHAVETPHSASLEPLRMGSVWAPSPLLRHTPPFIRLHFRIDADGSVRSPQAPPPEYRAAAIAAGVTPGGIDAAATALENFEYAVETRGLLARVTRDTAPGAAVAGRSAIGEPDPRNESYATPAAPDMSAAAEQPQTQIAPATALDEQQLKNVAEQRQREDLAAQQRSFSVASERRVAEGTYAGGRAARAGSSSLLRKSEAEASPASAPAPQPAPRATGFADAAEAAREVEWGEGVEVAGASLGPLEAMWESGELVFARLAEIGGRRAALGAWLDWPEIERWLLGRVADLLPAAALVPLNDASSEPVADGARRLAFLPIALVPGPVDVRTRAVWSPLRVSLGAAWLSAGAGACALALLLHGTLRLSERRGAFVSAVTHELRTPLTTFRMYTEMLSGGMVTDESRRRSYLETLRRESERLSHLVENVLGYSRIERGRAAGRREETTPAELVARLEDRLRERLAQAHLALIVRVDDCVAQQTFSNDRAAIEQILFNLIDNAAKYGHPPPGGPPEVILEAGIGARGRLAFRVIDHGPGLSPGTRRRLFEPFSKSASEAAESQPGVGLGLAFSRRLAREELGGDLVLESTGPNGTVFRLDTAKMR